MTSRTKRSSYSCHLRLEKKQLYLQYPRTSTTTTLLATSQENDPYFDGRTTFTLIAGQSLLAAVAVAAALIFNTPNYSLGPNISFNSDAVIAGILYALPLFALAYALDLIEERFPALQDVTKATQRSVIALLGGTLKPLLALLISTALSLAAGFGEEMLFRGVLQYELAQSFDSAIAIGLSSLVFGLLHAVTPLYALLATLASVYFGYLYQAFGNLAVPIVCHALYDVGALLWAHWTVTQMTSEERKEIVNWTGPNEKR